MANKKCQTGNTENIYARVVNKRPTNNSVFIFIYIRLSNKYKLN